MGRRIKFTPASLKQLTLNESEREKSIFQNVKCILMTKKGTVPLYREFGCTQSFVDLPINKATPLYYAKIKSEIEKYEPRVTVKSIEFDIDPAQPGVLIPTLEVEINENE